MVMSFNIFCEMSFKTQQQHELIIMAFKKFEYIL